MDPDLIIVAAAGNHGVARQFFPAASSNVLGVGAIDAAGERAHFLDQGGGVVGASNYGPWVDVVAPGVDLHSTFLTGEAAGQRFEGWAYWDGTSFAAAAVAGTIAALMSEHGTTAAAATNILLANPAEALKTRPE